MKDMKLSVLKIISQKQNEEKNLNIQAEMDASESYIPTLRLKIFFYLYFIGIEERANNLCGDVDHQTKKN